MNDGPIKTLFLPLETGQVQTCPHSRVLFLNAQYHPALSSFDKGTLHIVQHFKPYAEILERRGYEVHAAPEDKAQYDMALIHIPKSMSEAQYEIALALNHLKPGSIILCAADNKAGGNRIEKMLQECGIENVNAASKNKARAAWGSRPDTLPGIAEKWLEQGRMQRGQAHNYSTQPGIFGWDKIDLGSKLLLQALEGETLSGHGADFGCGYGFLSCELFKNRRSIKSMLCIDADHRAVQCCRMNIEELPGEKRSAKYLWLDLTSEIDDLKNHIRPLDFIVMNPPFHEGKKESAEIGKKFIRNAAWFLQRGGHLHMVANAHLPYEEILAQHFAAVQKLDEKQGFKIYKARK